MRKVQLLTKKPRIAIACRPKKKEIDTSFLNNIGEKKYANPKKKHGGPQFEKTL